MGVRNFSGAGVGFGAGAGCGFGVGWGFGGGPIGFAGMGAGGGCGVGVGLGWGFGTMIGAKYLPQTVFKGPSQPGAKPAWLSEFQDRLRALKFPAKN
ncbi:hypothetical protein BSKO_07274 [Bryopsis sp. KO-2023]|nr:hypothetical protein BSKO_07274 [Bryopsis sp. KO-2023]